MSKIELTVILPVYNVERYLEQCLQSLINQTLKEIEIVIINDGSTDNSGKIISEYSNRYNNIKVINQGNSGLSAARNRGIEIASGDYIAFIDSDDYVDKNMLKEMLLEAKKNNLDIVICNYERVYDDSDLTEKVSIELEPYKIYTGNELLKKFLINKITPNACDKIFKRDLFTQNKIIFPNGYYHEDLLTTFKILCSVNKGSYINKEFYKYRCRKNSITNGISIKNIEDMEYVIGQVNKSFRDYFGFKSKLEDYIGAFNIINFNICVYMSCRIKDSSTSVIIRRLYKNYLGRGCINNKLVDLREKIKLLCYKFGLENFMWKIRE